MNTLAEKEVTLNSFNIGNTNLLEIKTPEGHGRIFAKCEWENPNGSIKDRAALAMLNEKLKDIPQENWKDIHIIEYSGGNLGVSLAYLCNRLGIRLTLFLSSASSHSILKKIRDYGAKYILVEKSKGFIGVMKEAINYSKRHKDVLFLYQHENYSNLTAHKKETGTEILKQLDGLKIDAWVASIGTGGTLIGVYEALVDKYSSIELHAVTPAELPYGSMLPPNGLRKYAGSGGLGNGVKQSFVEKKESNITKEWTCSFENTLIIMKEFYDETNIKIGTSAAANLKVAKEVAKNLGSNSVVVTVFPDAGSVEEWEAVDSVK